MTLMNEIGRRLPDSIEEPLWQARERIKLRRMRLDHARRLGGSRRPVGRILFHPEPPFEYHTVFKMVARMGYSFTTRPDRAHDLAVFFSGGTYERLSPEIAEIQRERPVINAGCLDISKSRVNEAFLEAFGYALGVDPETHVGVAVAKSEVNAQHDGREVQCPTTPVEGVSYQRLVNTVTPEGDRVVVFRVPVVGDQIPVVYRKTRPIEHHLGDADAPGVDELATQDVFSQEEIDATIRFCGLLGLDLGELDMLRDNDDKRLYIVDANSTPWGPPLEIILDGRLPGALDTMAASYERLFRRFGAGS